jgi:hypothetical protein
MSAHSPFSSHHLLFSSFLLGQWFSVNTGSANPRIGESIPHQIYCPASR